MANTKSFDIRLQVMDYCLRGGNKFSRKEIMDKYNVRLENESYKKVTSKDTFFKDLLYIENNYNVTIERERSGFDSREILYYYEDPKFSIYNVPLSEEQTAQIAQTLIMLQSFEGMPNAKWLDDIIDNFKNNIDVDSLSEPVVGFSDNPDLQGKQHFTTLLRAITQKRSITITYKSYKKGMEFKSIVHPYYLKQYNNRWFLFALNEKYNNISNFAFDRIVKIENCSHKYIPNENVNFFDYFDEMVGVSRNVDSVSEKVKFWVSKSSQPYIATKPINGSQRQISEDENGAVFEIDIIINYELKQLLLSFGCNLAVLSPEHLRNDLISDLHNLLTLYESSESTERKSPNFAEK